MSLFFLYSNISRSHLKFNSLLKFCDILILSDEFEERSMIEPASYEDPRLKELINVLIEWINDELAEQRIIVKDIEEDLYDGQVLQKLLGKNSSLDLLYISVRFV